MNQSTAPTNTRATIVDFGKVLARRILRDYVITQLSLMMHYIYKVSVYAVVPNKEGGEFEYSGKLFVVIDELELQYRVQYEKSLNLKLKLRVWGEIKNKFNMKKVVVDEYDPIEVEFEVNSIDSSLGWYRFKIKGIKPKSLPVECLFSVLRIFDVKLVPAVPRENVVTPRITIEVS